MGDMAEGDCGGCRPHLCARRGWTGLARRRKRARGNLRRDCWSAFRRGDRTPLRARLLRVGKLVWTCFLGLSLNAVACEGTTERSNNIMTRATTMHV